MLLLTGQTLTLEELATTIEGNEKVVADQNSLIKAEKSHQIVEKIVADKRIVYGINTGFGKFSDVLIDSKKTKELQLNLIRSHACGVGEPFPENVSRFMLILRANALLKGFSGVRPIVINMLLDLVNLRIHPVIPQQGSLGASGDLAPLSHLALTLIGEGEVYYQGKRVPTSHAFKQAGLSPLSLEAKEGLALINGTQAMTAMGALAYLEAEKLAYQSELIAAMSLEGLRGIMDAFHEEVHFARGYKQQIETAKRIRAYLHNSRLISRQGEYRVQDAYSLRCIPQVHGATWQALDYVKEKLEIEMNAASDNPLIFEQQVISGGNFHGQPIALAMDFMKIAVAELASISERRIERLVNPQLSDLPPFLSPEPGLQSGAMILQYTAAALVSENKTLAHPASVDSIPSSANQEDHVSMGTIGARHAYQIVQNTRNVVAIEFICAMQAVDYRGIDQMADKTRAYYMEGRAKVGSIQRDRIFSNDIKELSKWLKEEGISLKIRLS